MNPVVYIGVIGVLAAAVILLAGAYMVRCRRVKELEDLIHEYAHEENRLRESLAQARVENRQLTQSLNERVEPQRKAPPKVIQRRVGSPA